MVKKKSSASLIAALADGGKSVLDATVGAVLTSNQLQLRSYSCRIMDSESREQPDRLVLPDSEALLFDAHVCLPPGKEFSPTEFRLELAHPGAGTKLLLKNKVAACPSGGIHLRFHGRARELMERKGTWDIAFTAKHRRKPFVRFPVTVPSSRTKEESLVLKRVTLGSTDPEGITGAGFFRQDCPSARLLLTLDASPWPAWKYRSDSLSVRLRNPSECITLPEQQVPMGSYGDFVTAFVPCAEALKVPGTWEMTVTASGEEVGSHPFVVTSAEHLIEEAVGEITSVKFRLNNGKRVDIEGGVFPSDGIAIAPRLVVKTAFPSPQATYRLRCEVTCGSRTVYEREKTVSLRKQEYEVWSSEIPVPDMEAGGESQKWWLNFYLNDHMLTRRELVLRPRTPASFELQRRLLGDQLDAGFSVLDDESAIPVRAIAAPRHNGTRGGAARAVKRSN